MIFINSATVLLAFAASALGSCINRTAQDSLQGNLDTMNKSVNNSEKAFQAAYNYAVCSRDFKDRMKSASQQLENAQSATLLFRAGIAVTPAGTTRSSLQTTGFSCSKSVLQQAYDTTQSKLTLVNRQFRTYTTSRLSKSQCEQAKSKLLDYTFDFSLELDTLKAKIDYCRSKC